MLWEKLKARYQENRKRAAEAGKILASRTDNIAADSGRGLWLVVGLGNFGPEYEQTRHNCGFRALECIADKLSGNVSAPKHRFKGLLREAEYKGNKLLLLWPYTYMNNSGESIREAMNWYSLTEDHLIVLYDDCDIEAGKIRIRQKGSAGTHNGMKSVLTYTETDEFPRVRIGIGKKPEHFDMIDFVLGKFSPEESPLIQEAEQSAAEAALCIISDGAEKAMSLFNSPRKLVNQTEAKGDKAPET